MAQDRIEIKRVNKEDYNKVVEMFPPDEIFSGFDYLKDCFHMLIGMPNVEAYAAVIDNKFASFLLVSVVDNGKTRVGRAGRTIRKYEKLGLNQRLMQYFGTTSNLRFNNIYHASCANKAEEAVQRIIAIGRRYKVLQKDFITYVCANKSGFGNILYNNVKLASAKLINEGDLWQIFCNQQLCSQLFPEGRIIVDFVPYRILKSNASLMKTERTTVVGSNLDSTENALLTFINPYRAHVGLVWVLDIFGHIDSTLNEHLLLHYNNQPLANIRENILIRCLGSENTKWHLLSSLMSELRLGKWRDKQDGIICTERILSEPSKM